MTHTQTLNFKPIYSHTAVCMMWPVTMQDMRKRKAGLEVKERHGQTCVPGALLVRVDTVQAALSLVPATLDTLLPYLLSAFIYNI